ncbi:MAG: TetR/AcrR family transcriptional regulator [Spirochaetia bacterium]
MMKDSNKPYTEVFKKIPEEKREKIFFAAVEEFASQGFEKARISDIAARAGISHGSVYTYFKTKDDILRYIIGRIAEVQDTGFSNEGESSVMAAIRSVVEKSFIIAEKYPSLMAVWLSLSFSYNRKFAEIISGLEAEGIASWQNMLREGIKNGDLPPDTDISAAAYILDSTTANILRGYISEHEEKKLHNHFGSPADKGEMVERILDTVKKMLY